MKREIKFRAWDLGAKQMYLPADIYGDIRDEIGISLNGDTLFFYESSNGNHCPPSLSTRRATVELMQFTGLLDKNGKEIYEGDIVDLKNKSSYNGLKVVVWDNILLCHVLVWANEYKNWKGTQSGATYFKVSSGIKCVLAGNIYETPNLLTTPDGGK